MASRIRRGDVWLAAVDKVRPVIVLTRDPMAEVLNDVLVVPVTSRERFLEVEVAVDERDGVAKPSIANLDTVTRVASNDLLRRVGVVRSDTMDRICRSMAIAVGCE